ncbi:MAG: ABC transporter ATP-binding protein [Chloroflexi bacterium]|nr:ABC transporter ATP-binding protein [Chloroflexota bacterium]
MTVSIQFKNVSKKYAMEPARSRSLQETILRLFRRKQAVQANQDSFWVLKEVSFEVYQGETLSLIGANGAGKSTLLKLITHIIKPTHGQIYLNGRISALLELGAGFHPDLTGRENIFLGGALAGLSPSEIEHRAPEIIQFANIGRFIDAPVRHYSSGMFVRLGFAGFA